MSETGSSNGTPRWVKVFGIIAIVLVLIVVIMVLIGGHEGPSRHFKSNDSGSQTPLFNYGSSIFDDDSSNP